MPIPITSPMTHAIHNDVWNRDYEYTFEHHDRNSVFICCWCDTDTENDKLIWSGSATWHEGDRIIDVIQDARDNCMLRRVEHGY